MLLVAVVLMSLEKEFRYAGRVEYYDFKTHCSVYEGHKKWICAFLERVKRNQN